MTKTRIFLFTFLSILGFALVISAQKITPGSDSVDQYAAPIDWKLYKISAFETAIKFPKLPVQSNLGDLCRDTQAFAYFAYADQVVYEFRFYGKAQQPIPSSCLIKEDFGQVTLDRRLTELRNSNPPPVSETEAEFFWRKIKVFRWETPNEKVIRWLLPDMGKNRWREVQISFRPEKKPEEKLFMESLIFSSINGIEIGSGSPITLGDIGFEGKSSSQPTTTESKQGLILKNKPRPPYTDLARQRNTQGEVRLKVTFLANGGIGAISVDSGLPNGLTEEAVSVAKKIVFLPARINNVPVTIVKQVYYGFSIY